MGTWAREVVPEPSKMLMPKKNRVTIYEHLFKEGVMVAEKDFHAPKHPELEGIPNLQVIKALTSLKSRGYVKEQFAWRHYYWYLTNEGIQYLRDYLHQGLEETNQRVTVLPTGRLLVVRTKLALLDLDPLPWSSVVDLDVENLPSSLLP